MKNLKDNFAIILIVMAAVFVFSACKKDKDSADDNGQKSGSYTYQGKTVDIVLGDYRDTGEDGSWIFFRGTASTDAVQLRFPKVGTYNIPTGVFQYSNLPYANAGYKPEIHFNGGLVTTVSLINGDEINGGTVTIKKEGDGYNISFDLSTTKGPLKGSFTGSLKKI